MEAKQRRALIEERVQIEGRLDFGSVATEFGVSEMTIRRDIETLENKGVVRRVLGGAIAFGGKSTEPEFEWRAAEASAEKTHIALAAVELLNPKETVVLDSGSTVLAVARAIKGKGLGLTVITPSILVVLELANEPDTTVIVTGGKVRPGELSMIGAEAEDAYLLYNCDTFVMGIAGVDGRRGVSEYSREEGSVKRAAVRASDRVIVVADETKLGRVQLMNVAAPSAITALVTDGKPDHPTVVALREHGVQVVCVDDTNSAVRE